MTMFKLTRAQYEAARKELKDKHGYELTGDNGSVHKVGNVLTYSYSEPELRVEVIKTFWPMTVEKIEAKLQEFITPFETQEA